MKRIGDYEGVHFTLGPISIHQFTKFYDVGGINGLRLFQYIRTKQGLLGIESGKNKPSTPVVVDNKTLYRWFGVSQPKKWAVIKKLETYGLIKVDKKGKGKAPWVSIIEPERVLN